MSKRKEYLETLVDAFKIKETNTKLMPKSKSMSKLDKVKYQNKFVDDKFDTIKKVNHMMKFHSKHSMIDKKTYQLL